MDRCSFQFGTITAKFLKRKDFVISRFLRRYLLLIHNDRPFRPTVIQAVIYCSYFCGRISTKVATAGESYYF